MIELVELLRECLLLSKMKQVLLRGLDLSAAKMRSKLLGLIANGCSNVRDKS